MKQILIGICCSLVGLLCLIIAGCAAYHGFGIHRISRSFTQSQESFGNPLMGYAPNAWYDTVTEDVTLLYMDITWRELEPEEGVYDWDSIEEENQLQRWRQEGKHIVLRFVCDIPDDEPHMDIPDWLYEKTEGAGTHYHSSYGYGFSPDYGNPDFLQAHSRAVAALGERYGQDGFISFVELGSLGHWGEWHVRQSAGIQMLPLMEVREQYVAAWVNAFPNAQILMRRPFAEAKKYGLGLYNDMAGHPEATRQWLDWIQNGGIYDQTGEENALAAMPGFWKTAAVGGELTSSLELDQMLLADLEGTISLVRDSHTTFLGPKTAKGGDPYGYDALLRSMGYRLWVSDMTLSLCEGFGTRVTLTWQNSGVAPFYGDWPVYLYILDEEQRVLESILVDIRLPQLLPGETVQTVTWLHTLRQKSALEEYTLLLGIQDPMTGDNAVTFAVESTQPAAKSMILHPKN